MQKIPTILKGDDSGDIELTMAEGRSYEGATLVVAYQGVTREFTDLVAGQKVNLAFTHDETDGFKLGCKPLLMRLIGPLGAVETVENAAMRIKVTDCLGEVNAGGSFLVEPGAGAVPVTDVGDVGERYTLADLHAKINSVIHVLAQRSLLSLAVLLASGAAFGASARLDTLYNDDLVVTNVDEIAAAAAAAQSAASNALATATQAQSAAATAQVTAIIAAASATNYTDRATGEVVRLVGVLVDEKRGKTDMDVYDATQVYYVEPTGEDIYYCHFTISNVGHDESNRWLVLTFEHGCYSHKLPLSTGNLQPDEEPSIVIEFNESENPLEWSINDIGWGTGDPKIVWTGEGMKVVDRLATTNDLRVAIGDIDGAARVLPKYLHAVSFDDSYPDAAAEYYRSRGDGKTDGGCSAVRDGGFLYRNFDFPFDERAEFIVKMSAGPGRFASVGVAQVGTNLTEQIVTRGKPSRCYKWIPGATVDGVNEHGVVCEINVVDTEPPRLLGGDIHPLGAVRWALDNGTSAEMVATNLAARIMWPSGWRQNFHWMIADAEQTWIVENGTASNVTAVAEKRVMTNFEILPDTYAGMGAERYALLLSSACCITNAWYTRAYRRETNPPWVSDLADVIDHTNAIFDAWAAYPREHFRGQLNGGQPWWQSVHTSIYDITNRTLRVAVQETDDWYTFAVPVAGGGGGGGVDPEAVKRIIGEYEFPLNQGKPGFDIKSFSIFIPDVMSSPQEVPFVGDNTWQYAKIKDSLDELYQIRATIEYDADMNEHMTFRFSGHMNLIGVPDMEIRLNCESPWYDTPSHVFEGGVEMLMGGVVLQTADLVVTASMSGLASEHYVDAAVAGAGGGTDGQAVTNIIEGFALRQRFDDRADVPHAGIYAFAVSNQVTEWSTVLRYGHDESHRDIFFGDYEIEGYESRNSKIWITPRWNGTNWVFEVKIQPDGHMSMTCDAGSFTGEVADLTYSWLGTRHIGLDSTKVRFPFASAADIDDINIRKRDRDDNVITRNAYGPWIISSTDPNANFLVSAANSYGLMQGPTYDKAEGTWSLRVLDYNIAWVYDGTARGTEDDTSLVFNMVFDEEHAAYDGKVLHTNLTVRADREIYGNPGEQYASTKSVEQRRLKSDLSVYTDGTDEIVMGDFVMVLGFYDIEGVTHSEILQACEDAIGQPQLVWNDDFGDYVWDFSDPSRTIKIGGVDYAPMDWIIGSESDTYLYSMFFDPEGSHFFELTFLRYQYANGAKKIDGDRLAKMSDLAEAGIKTNDVKNIIDEHEKGRNFIDTKDYPHANVDVWHVWVDGAEGSPAKIRWNYDTDHVGLFYGKAIMSGTWIPIEITTAWEGTNWVFRPVGHLPASLGGDLVLPPFTGNHAEYNLPSPIGKLYVRAYEFSPLATVADAKDEVDKVAAVKYDKEAGNLLSALVTTLSGQVNGSNVVFAVTNYMSGAYVLDAAKLKMLELRDGQYREVYNSRDEILLHLGDFETNKLNATRAELRAEIAAVLAEMQHDAWGRRTSTGNPAPSNTVYTTEPSFVFGGGLEYERIAVGAGAVGILAARGAPSYTAGDSGTFLFKDATGENYFGYSMTQGYAIGVPTDGIRVEGQRVTLTYNIVGSCPIVMWCPALFPGCAQDITGTGWYQLNDEEGNPIEGAPFECAVDMESTPEVATVYIDTGVNPTGFFSAWTSVPGKSSFKTNMPVDLDAANGGGVLSSDGVTVIVPQPDGTWRPANEN